MKLKNIVLFLLCLLIGMGFVLQAKLSDGQRLYVSKKVIGDYQITIESERKDIENLQTLQAEAGQKLKEYTLLSATDSDELKKSLQEELALYEQICGVTDVEGEGVVVSIDDGTRDLYYEGENVNNLLVHDSDLLTIINDLNAAGAEAISLNGQRIINTTEIACSGYTVRVNQQFYARPFEIQAIGDSKRLAAALIGPDGYGTLLKEWGLIVKVAIKDRILIPKISEEKNLKYVSKSEEGEQN